MRACVIGGGLAGSLLAWRLAGATGWDVDLALGRRGTADATAASGGAVRAYERLPEQRRLATASMAELVSSGTLRGWSDYRQVGSVYVRQDPDALDHELTGIASARVASAAELAGLGWSGLPAGAAAVVENQAGYLSPGRLRAAVLADALRRGVAVRQAPAGAVVLCGRGLVACVVAGQRREYDVVVVAAGAWTAAVLHASGLPSGGYRTKSIQYAVYRVAGWRPPAFVDEPTGLYGRPTDSGGLLLGLPTNQWDVDPDVPPTSRALQDAAVRQARARFPRLRVGPVLREVGAADCYCEQPVLALRPVVTGDHRLFTFSGGAGGSVKTVLAASNQAATELADHKGPIHDR